MKHTFYILTFAVAAMAGCSKNDNQPQESTYGSASFALTTSVEAIAITRTTTILPAELIPTPEAFTLRIISRTDTPAFDQSWDIATKLDTLKALRGGYTATLSHGDIHAEGPAAACFGGETDFTILARRTTPVVATAALQNAAFCIHFDQWFENYYTKAKIIIRTESGKEFAYTDSNDELIFIKPSTKLFMYGTAVKSQNGTKVEFPLTQIGLSAPRTIHMLTINASEAGAKGLEVVFDHTMTSIKERVIELNDEADQPEE